MGKTETSLAVSTLAIYTAFAEFSRLTTSTTNPTMSCFNDGGIGNAACWSKPSMTITFAKMVVTNKHTDKIWTSATALLDQVADSNINMLP